MSAQADPDLVKVTEIFLVPSSFLVAALGTADTNPHRAAVSLIGLVISGLWWVASREAFGERQGDETPAVGRTHSRRVRIMTWLPAIFVACWCLSIVVHLMLWNRPLGQ